MIFLGTENSDYQAATNNEDSYLLAFGGDDTLIGGTGNDNINGNRGNDFIISDDSLRYGGLDTLLGGRDNDVIVGSISYGYDLLFGNRGSDTLYASRYGGDTLYGGKDNDVLHAGAGNDILYGDEGDDLFVFDGGRIGGQDVVGDFSGSDTVSINGLSKGTRITIVDTGYMSCYINVGDIQTISVFGSQRSGLYDGNTFTVNDRVVDISDLLRSNGVDTYIV